MSVHVSVSLCVGMYLYCVWARVHCMQRLVCMWLWVCIMCEPVRECGNVYVHGCFFLVHTCAVCDHNGGLRGGAARTTVPCQLH